LHGHLPAARRLGATGRTGEGAATVSDRTRPEYDGLASQIDGAHDELADLLIAGDLHAAAGVLEGLRVLVWYQRAAEIRGRRHAGPGLRSLPRPAGRGGA
jgi:hypothetical protein